MFNIENSVVLHITIDGKQGSFETFGKHPWYNSWNVLVILTKWLFIRGNIFATVLGSAMSSLFGITTFIIISILHHPSWVFIIFQVSFVLFFAIIQIDLTLCNVSSMVFQYNHGYIWPSFCHCSACYELENFSEFLTFFYHVCGNSKSIALDKELHNTI